MNMITLEVEVAIKAKLPSLTQRAIRKLERAGIVVTRIDTSANRCTVHGTLKVKATCYDLCNTKETRHEVHPVRTAHAP